MADTANPQNRGRIRSGLQANTLVVRTIDFVYAQLPSWRDDPDRPAKHAEEHLNSQLCDYLNSVSTEHFPMVQFKHEERQVERRRVDLAVKPRQTIRIQTNHFSKYDPILVMEGKRLPTPGTGRQREYVTGGDSRTGGIQRFRLGLHGEKLPTAVVLGYIQSQSVMEWHQEINNWIYESDQTTDSTCTWTESDLLGDLDIELALQTARCRSNHDRIEASTERIQLHHLWVEM